MKTRAGALPCPTADTESLPHLTVEGDTATLSFFDWKNRFWRIEFDDVLAATYEARIPDGLDDDQTHEVMDSTWIPQLCASAGRDPRGFRHFIVCFNEGGGLCVNVAFRTFSVTSPNDDTAVRGA